MNTNNEPKTPWIVIAEDVKLMGRCICGQCTKNRDATCICGIKYSSTSHDCPACGRPHWCKS